MHLTPSTIYLLSALTVPLLANPLPPPTPRLPCVLNHFGTNLGTAIHHMQVTDNEACGTGSCAVSKLTEHTFGVEAAVHLDVGPATLVTGIVDEWTSGEEYECEGKPGDVVCVWVNVAYTEYHMTATNQENCEGESEGNVKFPHNNNWGGGYLCVYGDGNCRSNGASYWSGP